MKSQIVDAEEKSASICFFAAYEGKFDFIWGRHSTGKSTVKTKKSPPRHAVDISEDALDVAIFNIEQHELEHQVFPMLSDGYNAIKGQTYDLIVTNPPYVDAEDMADLPDEYHHEPELGLASGHDGLELTRRILSEAAEHLNDGGWLICEVGNSMVALQELYPDLPLQWLEFERGGLGVFAITKAELERCQHLFKDSLR